MMNSFTAQDEEDEVEIATEQYAYNRLAVDANPLSHVAKGHLAVSSARLYQLGDKTKGDEALKQLRELVQMLPGYEPVYHQLAITHLIVGQPEEAIAILDEYAYFVDGLGDISETSVRLYSIAEEESQKMQASGR